VSRPNRLNGIEYVLVDASRRVERDALAVFLEDGTGAAIIQGHHDLQGPLRECPGIVGADHKVGELIDQIDLALQGVFLLNARS
jgi:hypothetical protein